MRMRSAVQNYKFGSELTSQPLALEFKASDYSVADADIVMMLFMSKTSVTGASVFIFQGLWKLS